MRRRFAWLLVSLVGLSTMGGVVLTPVFTPKKVTIKIGDTVTWTNNGAVSHTSTGNAPLNLWDSGTVTPGNSFGFTFFGGGKYPYHCTFHQSLGMTGTVSVKIKASPPSGPQGTVFTITVGTIDDPAPFRYDIQWKRPGDDRWMPLFSIKTKSFTFDSTGQPPGIYRFRSRIRNPNTMVFSDYSVPKAITVTS